MKTHLMIGSRTACDTELPRRALLTIDPACVNCLQCRRTKLFKLAFAAKPGPRKTRDGIQMELFPT